MRLYLYTIMRRLFLCCALTSGLLPSTHSRHSISGGCLDAETSARDPAVKLALARRRFKPLATTTVV